MQCLIEIQGLHVTRDRFRLVTKCFICTGVIEKGRKWLKQDLDLTSY